MTGYEPPKKAKQGRGFSSEEIKDRDDFGGFQREKRTSEWIRDFLREYGPCGKEELYEEYSKWCQEKGYKVPKYESFSSYFSVLCSLNLIEFVTDASSDEEPKKVYQVNSDKLDEEKKWKWPHGKYYEEDQD